MKNYSGKEYLETTSQPGKILNNQWVPLRARIVLISESKLMQERHIFKRLQNIEILRVTIT